MRRGVSLCGRTSGRWSYRPRGPLRALTTFLGGVEYGQYAPSSRLVLAVRGIATTASRCDAGFHHGLLRLAHLELGGVDLDLAVEDDVLPLDRADMTK